MSSTISITLLLLLATLSTQADELTTTLRLIPEYHQAESRSRQELEARYQKGGFNVLATGVMDTQFDNEVILNELYYDTVIANQEMSFGKKIMSWGVGYGYRPLDVLEQEDRRLLYSPTLEGVPLIAWDYFSEGGSAFTLAYINPLGGQDNDRLDQESLALKYYGLWDNTDIHAVARFSRQNKLETGIGFIHIINENLEWHGSALYQHRYYKRLTSKPFDKGINAILGLSWTHSNGTSLLGEFWFDNAANQQNLLLRLSNDGDSVDTALDWLYTPQDGGWMLTASIKHERNRQKLELGVRTFGGSADSAFRAGLDDFVVYLSWEIAFVLGK
ncbi:hypothetical protein PN36_23610 [Candidatus Thiomargarita nelsonii]|uniref:Uncharacterized protein n=1 Tax=Candidatus Thiomargarita nelsonii TaxID=1003181 RepID=A0A4E0QZH3_9GAMM|nr:hypothetical protein PN36_23610 [Candidatus Thiomargarita nelsonii]